MNSLKIRLPALPPIESGIRSGGSTSSTEFAVFLINSSGEMQSAKASGREFAQQVLIPRAKLMFENIESLFKRDQAVLNFVKTLFRKFDASNNILPWNTREITEWFERVKSEADGCWKRAQNEGVLGLVTHLFGMTVAGKKNIRLLATEENIGSALDCLSPARFTAPSLFPSSSAQSSPSPSLAFSFFTPSANSSFFPACDSNSFDFPTE